MTRMSSTTVGPLLRRWRLLRRYSQLELSAEAAVSQRHLSHLETGKSRPSREMLLHLADVLTIPHRETNSLLLAAGFAPQHRHAGLDDPAMEDLRSALDLVLERHRPYPALVVDRYWDLVAANPPATLLTSLFAAPRMAEIAAGNLMRLLLHPSGLRSVIANFDEVAAESISRLRRDADHYPADERIIALVEELESYVTITRTSQSPGFVIPIHFRSASVELAIFSTVGSLGSPSDVLAQELVIETFYPMSAKDDEILRSLS